MQDKIIRSVLTMGNYFKPPITPIYCKECGTKLKVYYAEEKVYAVKCGYCEYIGVVKAKNPDEAALCFGKKGGEQE